MEYFILYYIVTFLFTLGYILNSDTNEKLDRIDGIALILSPLVVWLIIGSTFRK